MAALQIFVMRQSWHGHCRVLIRTKRTAIEDWRDQTFLERNRRQGQLMMWLSSGSVVVVVFVCSSWCEGRRKEKARGTSCDDVRLATVCLVGWIAKLEFGWGQSNSNGADGAARWSEMVTSQVYTWLWAIPCTTTTFLVESSYYRHWGNRRRK